MALQKADIAIAGGGLAGGLIALAVARSHPAAAIALVEGGERPGGNHRWSWFGSDLDAESAALLSCFPSARWNDSYTVRFPAYSRALPTPYNSLASRDFADTLERTLKPGSIMTGQTVAGLDAGGVTLASGTRIEARHVIDCRGLKETRTLRGGWQVFLGQEWRLDRPHGMAGPVIMDATVVQADGYRFLYLLPLGADTLFLEDTYYADTPVLDEPLLRQRIADYVRARGWSGKPMAEETGTLPVITGGDFAAFQEAHRTPGVARAGARGGFVHPLTSYTLPHAARVATLVARALSAPHADLAAMLDAEARRHWQATGFYRLLGRMLFGAAHPAQRYRVFQHFYRLPAPLIERFYAARSTWADRARILAGRPPVPVTRAFGALASHCPPLARTDPSHA
ncbi:lycopene cyclase [Erythrobacteraceae bacterium CFH 75059]|uniref:lycopene beta-cyclase CrtY n=1 Tax=Qipengyuania thermophila TaxID=2509361 RepID=UPI00101EB3A4|nr:lycopene beta-cyclase CrtY [Qipengyuania thermophila]TCD04846.1 lycopene cyclase [Erythrobacteraceae bacterium CFH 75059]